MNLGEVIETVNKLASQLEVLNRTIFPDVNYIVTAKNIYENSKDRKVRSRIKKIVGTWNSKHYLDAADRKFIIMNTPAQ